MNAPTLDPIVRHIRKKSQRADLRCRWSPRSINANAPTLCGDAGTLHDTDRKGAANAILLHARGGTFGLVYSQLCPACVAVLEPQ